MIPAWPPTAVLRASTKRSSRSRGQRRDAPGRDDAQRRVDPLGLTGLRGASKFSHT